MTNGRTFDDGKRSERVARFSKNIAKIFVSGSHERELPMSSSEEIQHFSNQECNKKRGIIKSIVFDSILFLLLLAAAIATFFFIKPRHVGFFCGDISLTYPYRPDTISTGKVLATSLSIAFITIFGNEMIKDRKRNVLVNNPSRLKKATKFYGMFLFGFFADQLIVEIAKSALGKLRPNFLTVCQPDIENCTINSYISQYKCTETGYSAYIMRDIHRALPSGHAAASLYSVFFIDLYIQERVEVSVSVFIKPVIQIILLCAAIYCAMTRVSDHKHDLFDIYSGWFIGVFVALFVFYKMTFPLMSVRFRKNKSLKHSNSMVTTYSMCSDESEPMTPSTPAPLIFMPQTSFNGRSSSGVTDDKRPKNNVPFVQKYIDDDV